MAIFRGRFLQPHSAYAAEAGIGAMSGATVGTSATTPSIPADISSASVTIYTASDGSEDAMAGNGVPPATDTPMGFQPLDPNGENKKRSVNKKKVAIVFAIIVVVLGGVYGGGAWFFSTHFFPNTYLSTQDLSFQPSEVLASSVQGQVDAYALTITGEGFTCTINQDESDINIDAVEVAQNATGRQDNWRWFIEIFNQHDVSDLVVATYDTEALSNVIDTQVAAFNKNQKAPEDASVSYDSTAGIFVVKDEVYGKQLDASAVYEKAAACVTALTATCELTEKDLLLPSVMANDEKTKTAIATVNSMFSSNVKLMLNGTVEAATITKAQIAEWVSINPGDYAINLDGDAVSAWVTENTSDLNTVGTTRTWTREDGVVCTVSGGTYGWKVDTSSLATTVYDTLLAGGATTINIACTQSADVYNGAGGRDWGAYVDIDVSEQTVRYYDASGNLLYSCSCITGNTSKGYDTPAGVYSLRAVQGKTTLTGEDYTTVVNYWMPFIRNSVGLHDATWHSKFGGTIYQTNGSHGCVNLSLSDAAWFYQNLSKGVCVIVHD